MRLDEHDDSIVIEDVLRFVRIRELDNWIW